jgi:hypothetical protein
MLRNDTSFSLTPYTTPRRDMTAGLTHDEAVFVAYGWKSDLSDEEILEKLLALNLERAKS